MNRSSESGQILVLVLLVILVGVTVGLSIASRTLSNLKNTAELDQSNRAFSAAEAGIERALSALQADPQACDAPSSCAADFEGISADVVVSTVGGNDRAFGINALAKDDVIQANLDGYSGRYLTLYWGLTGDRDDCVNLSAAAVVSVVYEHSGQYGLGKAALDECLAGGRNPGNGFTRTGIQLPPASEKVTIQDGSQQDGFAYKYTLDLQPGQSLIPSGATIKMVRVRLMYNGPKPIALVPQTSHNLPNQGQQITSTAEVGGTQRTVKVLKTTPALPAIFDYALFNGSTSSLTK